MGLLVLWDRSYINQHEHQAIRIWSCQQSPFQTLHWEGSSYLYWEFMVPMIFLMHMVAIFWLNKIFQYCYMHHFALKIPSVCSAVLQIGGCALLTALQIMCASFGRVQHRVVKFHLLPSSGIWGAFLEWAGCPQCDDNVMSSHKECSLLCKHCARLNCEWWKMPTSNVNIGCRASSHWPVGWHWEILKN